MTENQTPEVHDWKQLAKVTCWDKQPPEDTLQNYIIAILAAYAAMNTIAKIHEANPTEIYRLYLTASLVRLTRHMNTQDIQELLFNWLSEEFLENDIASSCHDDVMAMVILPKEDNQTN